jgi:hypothetical protein
VLVRELAGYLRGRAPSEIPALFQRSLAAHGHPADTIVPVASEVEALQITFC